MHVNYWLLVIGIVVLAVGLVARVMKGKGGSTPGAGQQ